MPFWSAFFSVPFIFLPRFFLVRVLLSGSCIFCARDFFKARSFFWPVPFSPGPCIFLCCVLYGPWPFFGPWLFLVRDPWSVVFFVRGSFPVRAFFFTHAVCATWFVTFFWAVRLLKVRSFAFWQNKRTNALIASRIRSRLDTVRGFSGPCLFSFAHLFSIRVFFPLRISNSVFFVPGPCHFIGPCQISVRAFVFLCSFFLFHPFSAPSVFSAPSIF